MIEPDEQQLATLVARAGADGDGPKVMLNLNRYRSRAAYETPPADGSSPKVSGHEAYPSLEAFRTLVTDPALVAAYPHRAAGLERAAILVCGAGPDPVLRGPFG